MAQSSRPPLPRQVPTAPTRRRSNKIVLEFWPSLEMVARTRARKCRMPLRMALRNVSDEFGLSGMCETTDTALGVCIAHNCEAGATASSAPDALVRTGLYGKSLRMNFRQGYVSGGKCSSSMSRSGRLSLSRCSVLWSSCSQRRNSRRQKNQARRAITARPSAPTPTYRQQSSVLLPPPSDMAVLASQKAPTVNTRTGGREWRHILASAWNR